MVCIVKAIRESNMLHVFDVVMVLCVVSVCECLTTQQLENARSGNSVVLNDAETLYPVKISDWFEMKDNFIEHHNVAQISDNIVYREAVICDTIMQKLKPQTQVPWTSKCLFDEGEPRDIAINSHCTIKALGSVTPVSDLDFTIMCKGIDAEAHNYHSEELEYAERMWKALPDSGTQFDTNFYTNVFDHKRTVCSKVVPIETRIGYALQSLTRATNTAAGSDNGYLSPKDFDFRYPFDNNGDVTIRTVNPDLITTAMKEIASESEIEDVKDRTAKYFSLLHEGEKQESDCKKFTTRASKLKCQREYCKTYSQALIYANEAYWTLGAVAYTVWRERNLNTVETLEAAMMNIGYAVEHACHEQMTVVTGKYNAWKKGEALIKWGKYMLRVNEIMATELGTKKLQENLSDEFTSTSPAVLMNKKKDAGKETSGEDMQQLYYDLGTRDEYAPLRTYLGIDNSNCERLHRYGWEIARVVATHLRE